MAAHARSAAAAATALMSVSRRSRMAIAMARRSSSNVSASRSSTTAAQSSQSSGAGRGHAPEGEGGGLSPSGVAFFGSLCLGTFGLGTWQTKRYFEKVEQMAHREEGLACDPVPLEVWLRKEGRRRRASEEDGSSPSSSSSGSSPSSIERGQDGDTFRRVTAVGTYRHADEVLVGPRGPPPGALASSGPGSGRSSGGMSSGPQGYFVITPLLVRSSGEEGTVVLVNRGWVPMHLAKNGDGKTGEWDRPVGEVEVVGVPTETETPRFMSPPHPDPRKLLWMDRTALEVGTDTAEYSPILLTETTTKMKTTTMAPMPSFPVTPDASTVGEFKVTPPIHAGYAVTWFGLSGAGMIMTRKLMTRGRG